MNGCQLASVYTHGDEAKLKVIFDNFKFAESVINKNFTTTRCKTHSTCRHEEVEE
jgi:hypothetical protein